VIAETFGQLLRDPSHWAFEVTSDLVLGGLGALVARPLIRRAVRLHDERNH
jgi:hypothetical protein